MESININLKNIKDLETKFNSVIENINLKSLIYSSTDTKKILALGFVCRIIENTQALIILLREGNLFSSISPILRNTLEAIIDLDNLINVDGYVEYLKYLQVDKTLSLSNKNYFKRLYIEKNFNYKELRSDYEVQAKSLENEILTKYGKKYLNKYGNIDRTIYFKFKISKSLDTYDSMYYLLCNDTHNNISSIEQNYINQNMEVSIFNEISADEEDIICQTSIYILNDLLDRIYILFDINTIST